MDDASSRKIRSGPLEISLNRLGHSHTLELSGELDLATAPTFGDEIEAAVVAGAEVILVDMTGLEFIDSTGIAVLVRAHKRLNDGNGSRFLLIASEAPEVTRVMRLTDLDRRLRFIGPRRELPAG